MLLTSVCNNNAHSACLFFLCGSFSPSIITNPKTTTSKQITLFLLVMDCKSSQPFEVVEAVWVHCLLATEGVHAFSNNQIVIFCFVAKQ